jgi:proteasome accessory factor A
MRNYRRRGYPRGHARRCRATRWVYGGVAAWPAPQAGLAAASFADESCYRRLKITGADPGLSQLATFVRAGATEQVLRLAESSVEVPVDHRGGTRSAGAVSVQRAYLAAARRIRRRPEDDIILDAWQAALDSHQDSQDPAPGSSDRHLVESPGAPAGDFRPVSAAVADLSQAGTLIATASQIETAVDLPPQTTRARLRGLFIKTAKDHRRDFTLDWVHLKLNDAAIRTVRCLDPLDASLGPAERLITSISGPPG